MAVGHVSHEALAASIRDIATHIRRSGVADRPQSGFTFPPEGADEILLHGNTRTSISIPQNETSNPFVAAISRTPENEPAQLVALRSNGDLEFHQQAGARNTVVEFLIGPVTKHLPESRAVLESFTEAANALKTRLGI